ncbi:MAG: hypothetical protein F4X76_01635 [Chloroflexi bacterium]|nr:hypothetical protein [Chloroflexota bacterium]
MNAGRDDLSQWAVHFVHDYNPGYEPDDSMIPFGDFDGFPYHHKKAINDRFDSWRISDDHYPIDPDPDALQVLLKIITDGHIRASWAFRNGRPTIYGPRAAVCFTEMPLYALVEYAERRNRDSVGRHAVGVLKKELFEAGGRPAIYGLAGNHKERHPQGTAFGRWPRFLDPSCGLGAAEQFRYVRMSVDRDPPIDWSHEREWRWADHEDRCSCPGMPIWLAEEPIAFSRAFVVVPDEAEVEYVIGRLQELHDAGANDADFPFRRTTLEATSVVALDQLRDVGPGHVRLEDIPARHIRKLDRPDASPELVEKVRAVLVEARSAADRAAGEHLRSAPRTRDGHVADVAGWAHLVVYDSQSPVVSALLELEEAWGNPGTGYYVEGIGGLGWRDEQALSVAEASVRAAEAVFREHFPDLSLRVETRWD